MGVANSDEAIGKFPGVGDPSGYYSTGAPGSVGATEADAMPDTGLSTQRTTLYESVQNVPVPTVGVGFDDTALPGQNREGISGLDADFIASTGAGAGSVSSPHHPGAS